MDKIRTKCVEDLEGGAGTVFLDTIHFPPGDYEVRLSTQSRSPKDGSIHFRVPAVQIPKL